MDAAIGPTSQYGDDQLYTTYITDHSIDTIATAE